MTQQPWRKRAIALVMGKESVEVISYPGPSGGDILRTGALPLFSKMASSGIASGMRLVFHSSHDQLGYRAPNLPSDFSAPCGQLRSFHSLLLLQMSAAGPRTSSLASSVFGATLDRPGGDSIAVVVKFGGGLEQEVRQGLSTL